MKIFLSFTQLFISLVVFGQEAQPTVDEIAFDEILDVYYDDEFDSTLTLYYNFLKEHPESALVPRVEYNIGHLLREIDQDEEAIPVFKGIIDSRYNDMEAFGGLMEQYTLFKHRSASNLADIYLDLKDYEKAKKYIRLFDKKYKYKHFCGNELAQNEIYTAKQYARLYQGQGNIDKGIKELLPHIFDNGLANNHSLLELLDELLNQRFSEDEIKNLVNQAYSTLLIKNESKASIEFLKTRIVVFDYHLFDFRNREFEENLKLEGKEKWEKAFKTNKFFAKYIE